MEKESRGNIKKSSGFQLRKRGWIDSTDLDKLSLYTDDSLFLLMDSGTPWERTASVRLLYQRKGIGNDLPADLLLEKLREEPCLYTRLEICGVLEKGDEHTARKMIPYLGKIGKNQYKELPGRVSGKSSYPLPRDIVSRSLARMDVSIMPVLLEVLESGKTDIIPEVIDAIGFMAFYNRSVATAGNLAVLLQAMEKYSGHPVIVWKCVLALSAFSSEETLHILEGIALKYDHIIAEEAGRSARIIRKRMNTA